MSLSSRLPWTFSRSPAPRGRPRTPASRCKRTRLFLEHLEDRALLASYTAPTVSDLIADISLSNTAGGSNTISLTAPTTSPYQFTAINNGTNGGNFLPVIAADDNLTIVGNGDTLQPARRGAGARFFDVTAGASLTLQNLTLEGGSLVPSSRWGGGAIYNQGALTLSGATVSENWLKPPLVQDLTPAMGGGIWSSGSLTLENGTLFSRNYAEGDFGDAPAGTEPTIHNPYDTASPPGNAYGGAVYIAGGTANISDATFTGNYAEGGVNEDGAGGPAFGGALYVAGGQVVMTTTSINGNQAMTWPGGVSFGAGVFVAGGTVTVANCTLDSNTTAGNGYGGALFVAGGTVALTNDTVESNTATYGGGLCVAAGTVTLTNGAVQSNTATYGGGLYVGTVNVPNASDTGVSTVSGATVYLDPSTFANTINNTDSSGTNGGTANIDGKYILT
jgi:hypothetical protein